MLFARGSIGTAALVLLVLLCAARSGAQEPPPRTDTTGQVAPPPEDTLAAPRVQPLDTIWAVAGGAYTRLPLAARGIEIIGAEEIANAPARDLGALLAWALGVDVLAQSPARTELALRGGTAPQLLLLVDGVRVGMLDSGPYPATLTVLLEDVERIEIIRGPSVPALGSDAAGGVVNVVTRGSGPTGGGARLESGSFGSFGAEATGRLGGPGARLGVGVGHQRSRGSRPGTDYRSTRVHAAARLSTGERALEGRMAAAFRELGAVGFHAPFPSFDPLHDVRTLDAGLTWQAPADARLGVEPQLRLHMEHNDHLLRRDDPFGPRNVRDVWRADASVTADYALARGFRGLLGVETRLEGVESSAGGRPGQVCSLEAPCRLTEGGSALFAEAKAGVTGHFALAAGIRVQRHSASGGSVTPSVSAAIWPGDGMRLRGALGRTVRAPGWAERFHQGLTHAGDPDLRPERGQSVELGADLMPSPFLRVAFTGFSRRSEDLIDWVRPLADPDSGAAADPEAGDPEPAAFWHATNIEAATFEGLEVEVTAADFRGSRVSVRATGLSRRGARLDTLASKRAFRPLGRTFSLVVDRALPQDFLLSARLLNARRAEEDAHTRVDARLTWRVLDARIYLDALNVLGARYLDVSGSPAPGRSFHLGASWGWTRPEPGPEPRIDPCPGHPADPPTPSSSGPDAASIGCWTRSR